MERPVEIQYLRPEQILASREADGIVYLPLGPIEWHGPHLPMGVDPLRAQLAAVALAREVGGVVLPTLYIGTERERTPEMLRNIGFQGNEYVVGMDFPACTLPSLYFKEEVFAIVLRNHLDLLIDGWGFSRVVIVNGHGAENHLAVIRRLIAEYEATKAARIVLVMPMEDFPDHGWGHATLEETETLMAHYPETVDLNALPPDEAPLKNTEWAIVDDATFRGRSDTGMVGADEDPRSADPERGRKRFGRTVRQLKDLLRKELS